MADLSREQIITGAYIAGLPESDGLSIDDVADALIEARSRKDRRGERALDIEDIRAAQSFNFDESEVAQVLQLGKLEDVLSGSEEADNERAFYEYSQEERDKGRSESKEAKRLGRAAENIAAEAAIRGGYKEDEAPEFEGRREYRQNAKYPAQYDPELDDFVVKRKKRILKFKQAIDEQGNPKPGDYRATRDKDGVIKRRMVKYRPGDTQQRYDPKTRQVVVRNIAPEPFYPGARNQEPYDGKATGRSAYGDAYEKLSMYIDSGAITDPQELEKALLLKQSMKSDLDPGYAKAQDFDRGVATVREDGKRFSPFIQQLNENRALRDSIINETEAANFADERLGNLGEVRIQGKGFKKNGKPDWISEAPITFENPADFPDAYRAPGEITPDSTVYFDRERGNPLAVQGPETQPITVNSPDAGQTFNSPESRPVIKSMEDLLIAQQYATRESGQYPQVDISGAMSTFNSRLSRVKGIAPELVGNAGSLQDVENAVSSVLGLAADTGARLNTYGTKVRATDPGPMEVLGKMRYTTPEVQQLSNALLQLELGRTNGVNSLAKSEFFSGTGSYMDNYPIGLGKGGQGRSVDLTAQGPAVSLGRDRMTFGEVEQMSDYTVGDNLDTANQRVAPAFRQLTGENIEGSPQERGEALADARRPFIGQTKGELVGIEGKKANPNYRYNKTGETDPFLIQDAIRDQARSRASRKNPRNLSREKQNIINAQRVNARHYPDVVKVARAGEGGRRRNPASISRDEYSLAQAGGSGMGGGPRPPVSTPGTDDFRSQPGTGGGLTTYGSSTSRNQKQTPDDSEFRQRVRKRLEMGQRARAGAVIAGGVGAAIAGIDGLIGGERDKREQEVYQ